MSNTTTRVLKQTNPVLTLSWYIDGTATDVGAVTLTLTDLDGNTVLSAGSTTNNADGTYSYTMTDAQTDALDYLVAVWEDTDASDERETLVEVVGGHLVTEAQVRAFDPSLADTTTYPDADIVLARDQVTDLLEQWTGRSWVPRYRRSVFKGPGGRELAMRDAVRSEGGSGGEGATIDLQAVLAATVSGTSQTVADIDVGYSELFHTTNTWRRGTTSNPLNVVVAYEYGQPALRDGVDRIALILIRDRLVDSTISDRTISLQSDFGTTRFALEGGPMRNPTKFPEVNQWIMEHDVRVSVS